MQEIVDGIFTWPWFSEPHGYNFNGHFIRHAEGNLCIDPVEPPPEVLDQLTEAGVSRILLTNRNHSRAANAVRAATGARVAVHADDAAHARDQGTEIDEGLAAGDTIGPLTVVDASGKSPGEVAFFWPERRILIVGDAVVGDPPGRCKLLPERVIDDLAGLHTSVARLLDLDFDTLLVGDGTSITAGAKAEVRALVDGFSG